MQGAQDPLATCTRCGGSGLQPAKVRSAFWEGERLVIVEDIPALVCADCKEHFYDEATTMVLDLLRGDGFPEARAKSMMSVPVFSFGERIAPKGKP